MDQRQCWRSPGQRYRTPDAGSCGAVPDMGGDTRERVDNRKIKVLDGKNLIILNRRREREREKEQYSTRSEARKSLNSVRPANSLAPHEARADTLCHAAHADAKLCQHQMATRWQGCLQSLDSHISQRPMKGTSHASALHCVSGAAGRCNLLSGWYAGQRRP